MNCRWITKRAVIGQGDKIGSAWNSVESYMRKTYGTKTGKPGQWAATPSGPVLPGGGSPSFHPWSSSWAPAVPCPRVIAWYVWVAKGHLSVSISHCGGIQYPRNRNALVTLVVGKPTTASSFSPFLVKNCKSLRENIYIYFILTSRSYWCASTKCFYKKKYNVIEVVIINEIKTNHIFNPYKCLIFVFNHRIFNFNIYRAMS